MIKRNVQDPLAEMILAGEVVDGDRVAISSEGNVLTFNGNAPQTAEIATFETPVPKRKLNYPQNSRSCDQFIENPLGDFHNCEICQRRADQKDEEQRRWRHEPKPSAHWENW